MEHSLAQSIPASRINGGEFTIGEVTSLAEVEEWQAIDQAVWPGERLETMPAHALVTHLRYGGLLLAARDAAGKMIGILLGFPGLKEGKVIHCSHLLGVLADWRGRDVGFHLKRRQRDYVLAQSLDLVVWTFDPLETRNARLNIARLGGVVREYSPNLYGIGQDGLNQGLETDRFTISWHIRHPSVVDRLAGRTATPSPAALLAGGIPLLTRTTARGGPNPYPSLEDVRSRTDAPLALIEAPASFQALKGADLEAARAWRLGLRELFLPLFAQGYAVVHALRAPDEILSARCYYLVGPADEYLAGRLSWDRYVA
ncbi:MAG TPA: hypothetical protein VNL35_18730 [Chloroflexota bacterium]|nr:hypothetical protein [Chloroflexota bacterium]